MDGIFLTTELLPTGGVLLCHAQNTVDTASGPIDIVYPPETSGPSGLSLRSD